MTVAPRNALEPGFRLGWYEVREVIGQGGFGITYLGFDTNLAQEVAIKEYLPVDLALRSEDHSVHPASDSRKEQFDWGKERFISEARNLARFKHPNIIRVLSVFESLNTAFMVMELARGESLHSRLSGRRTMNEAELRHLMVPLMSGLKYVHELGFVHRDVKPENIFIREDGSPVLLDFGSARQATGGLTQDLTAIVSPGYAPFEQYHPESDKQGPWTDIYGLGATLYRAASGVPPKDALDRSRGILNGTTDSYIPTEDLLEQRFSPGFSQAINRALAFRPEQRPQSIEEWQQDFAASAGTPPAGAPPEGASASRRDAVAMSPPSAGAGMSAVSEAPTRRVENRPKRSRPAKVSPEPKTSAPSRGGLWWAGAAIIACVAVAAVLMFQYPWQEVLDAEDIRAASSQDPTPGPAPPRANAAPADTILADTIQADIRPSLRAEPPTADPVPATGHRQAAEDPKPAPLVATVIGTGVSAGTGAFKVADHQRSQVTAQTTTPVATPTAPPVPVQDWEPQLRAAESLKRNGNLASPAGDNAAAIYREILNHDPANPRARAGLDEIVATLHARTEAALLDEDTQAAREALDLARGASPDRPELRQHELWLASLESEQAQRAAIRASAPRVTQIAPGNEIPPPASNEPVEPAKAASSRKPSATVPTAKAPSKTTKTASASATAVRPPSPPPTPAEAPAPEAAPALNSADAARRRRELAAARAAERALDACLTVRAITVSEPVRAGTGQFFAALAIGANNGWGEASGQPSQAQAEEVAMRNCDNNDSNCKVEVSSGQCVSFATGPSRAAGWAFGGSLQEARSKALSFCEEHTDCCTVRSSFCADEVSP